MPLFTCVRECAMDRIIVIEAESAEEALKKACWENAEVDITPLTDSVYAGDKPGPSAEALIQVDI